eukprot:scaffold38601_cov45-Phaeocystis_antarctica.AAC.2
MPHRGRRQGQTAGQTHAAHGECMQGPLARTCLAGVLPLTLALALPLTSTCSAGTAITYYGAPA